MTDRTELYAIGQLARRTGLTVRTIRFWSDLGLLPPTTRTSGGYRLYDAAAVARLDLLRTLRDLGIGLDAARRILDRQASVADVAGAHVRALDAEIRTRRVSG
ncbi:MerR family transcriptional regulator [Micromonospora sp. NPDC048830]|uniref:helix-turn-helix domain-containing protein n=1 Tax=Micromonospora sp. NPDC048830 TaxID=3364257 RepID=UPI00371C748A